MNVPAAQNSMRRMNNRRVQSLQEDPDLARNYQCIPTHAQCLEISQACERFWLRRGKVAEVSFRKFNGGSRQGTN
jgi:hypothetical protein